MIKLHFQTTEEFANLFKRKDKEVTDAIVQSVGEAVNRNKKSADLFEVSFEEAEVAYSISLPKAEWTVAVQSCLDHYHALSLTDEQIDTWKLLEIVKSER
jgi:hypothetical protein